MKAIFLLSLISLSTVVSATDYFNFTALIQGQRTLPEFQEECGHAETFYQRKLGVLEESLAGSTGGFQVFSTVEASNCILTVVNESPLKFAWRNSAENYSSNKVAECMSEMAKRKSEPNSVFAHVSFYLTELGNSCQVKQVVLLPR